MTTRQTISVQERRRTARVLAGASVAELTELWDSWPSQPHMEYVRAPESGLVMLQGRIGGTGDRFNIGEATVTRATVVLRPEGSPDATGTAYVLGSHPEHAGLAAIFDALLFTDERHRVLTTVIEPLEKTQAQADAANHAESRGTIVDFFTVARDSK